MKINVDVLLTTIGGEPMKDADESGKAVDATVKLALVNALLAPQQKTETGTDKIKKYELAKRIYAGGDVELSIDEVALCKKVVEDVFPAPLIVGQVVEILEGKREEA